MLRRCMLPTFIYIAITFKRGSQTNVTVAYVKPVYMSAADAATYVMREEFAVVETLAAVSERCESKRCPLIIVVCPLISSGRQR
jgi:hypothetical protein